MPLYVGLWKWTDQGRKNLKDCVKRERENQAAAEKAGIKVLQVLYTAGRYDKISIIEAPNAQVAFASGLAAFSNGMGTLESLEAYTVEEMEKIISRLP
jgi:uncharacterized protein with GYD domain